MKKQIAIIIISLLGATSLKAQMYTGLSGLINVPSADMNEEGDFQIGGYYMDSHFTPESDGRSGFIYDGEKYNTMDFYASITPFKWVEIGYTITLQKSLINGYDKAKYNQKDRYLSIKLNPIRESKWLPAIVIGSNDFVGSPTKRHSHGGSGAGYFCNYYVAATKHFKPYEHDISVNVAYRYCPTVYNEKWEGFVGGVTYRPAFYKDLRTIIEYTGNEVNIGVDCLLWKHLLIQAVLSDGKHLSGGVCYKANLF